MVDVKSVIITESFKKDVKKLKDKNLKERLKKQIKKIIDNSKNGKPLRYGLKGELTVYVKPYRLIYAAFKNKLVLLNFI